MPEFTAVTVALFALLLVLGVILGWILRADRCAKEKIAVNAGWQQQIESQQSEHDRLAKQNKSLMEQISQYQASIKDSTMRAKELSTSLKDTFQRRDELQRELKEVRGKLDVAVAQYDRLQSDLRNKSAKFEASDQAIQQRDERIRRLNAELTNWQGRVPPLVDRYRARDEEARNLESELDETRAQRDAALSELAGLHARIAALESVVGSEHTRIEPVDADALPDGLDASNEPHDDTIGSMVTGLRDQIDDDSQNLSSWLPEDNGTDQIAATADDDGPWAKVEASADEEPEELDEDRSAYFAPDTQDSLETSAENEVSSILSDEGSSVTSDNADSLETSGENDVSSFLSDESDTVASANPDSAETSSEIDLSPFLSSDDGAVAPDSMESSAENTTSPFLPDDDDAFFGEQRATVADADQSCDDLKLIKGVGPSIEKTLHDLGFFHFRQIAEMTEYDIDRVARQLKGFRSRIYREDWIGQARMLQLQKSNSPA